jgi:hypothetical protein
VVSLVDARLMQGRKTLARGSRLKPSRVGTVTLKLKRKLKKGRYAATLKLHDRAGHTRTVTSRFRVLK